LKIGDNPQRGQRPLIPRQIVVPQAGIGLSAGFEPAPPRFSSTLSTNSIDI
jgi:hypothetical protein